MDEEHTTRGNSIEHKSIVSDIQITRKPMERNFSSPPEITRRRRCRKKSRLHSINFIAFIKNKWEPGKVVAYHPRGIKSEICISKKGHVYYRNPEKAKWVCSKKTGEKLYRKKEERKR